MIRRGQVIRAADTNAVTERFSHQRASNAHRIFDPVKKAEAKSDTKAEPQPETKAEPEAKAEPTPEAKTKTPSDLTPGMIKRVHELYEELGRKDLQAVEELEKSERENRKNEVKDEPEPEAKAEPKPGAKAKSLPKAKTET